MRWEPELSLRLCSGYRGICGGTEEAGLAAADRYACAKERCDRRSPSVPVRLTCFPIPALVRGNVVVLAAGGWRLGLGSRQELSGSHGRQLVRRSEATL